LDCSSKFGILLVAGQNQLTIIRGDDVINAQNKAATQHEKHVELAQIPRIIVQNAVLSAGGPCIVAISNGDEFIAVDSESNGMPFVVIFKLEEFLMTVKKSIFIILLIEFNI
jgi:hypothetical protein